ncbi:MAG: radical SAM protein [Caldisphaeraceae archaeon]|nr:radical SAM protein [Caldisphaeraceae archaeon]
MQRSLSDEIKIYPSTVNIGKALWPLITKRVENFFERLSKGNLDDGKHLQIINTLETNNYALYVHMPFCHTPLCKFCCFVRYAYNHEQYKAYMKALRKEAEWLATTAESARIRVIYIGGGTPSIDIHSLSEFIDSARSYFGKNIEVSTEASPIDINDEAVSILRSSKVSRLSIGVQALEDKRLWELGRLHHRVGDSIRAVEAARGKFNTLNIDMLWGAKGDNVDKIKVESSKALDLNADQVTFYPLMPAPGLRELERKRKEGPWHPKEAQLYKMILQEVFSKKYFPATAWCMDRGSKLIDEYIVDFDKFLAIGISGIARIGNYAYVNTFSVEKYVKLVEKRGFSAIRSLQVDTSEDILYYISTKLFGLKVCPSDIENRFTMKNAGLISFIIAMLRSLDEEQAQDGCFHITDPNMLYLLHIMQRSIYMGVNTFREWGLRSQS